MNPVFAAKLATPATNTTITAASIQVAGNSQAPGALPRTPNPPGTTIPRPMTAAAAAPEARSRRASRW